MKKLTALALAAILAVFIPFGILAEAVEPADEEIPITEVYIEGLRPPVAGETPETSCNLYVEERQNYVLVYQYWHDNTLGSDIFDEQVPFDPNHQYSAGCMIAPDEGYYLADDCVYYFNGDPALVDQLIPSYFEGCLFVQSVAMDCVSGSSVIPGDVNLDGEATVSDALLALRFSMGLIELTDEQLEAADVNGNGECDMSDALLILRFGMGLLEGFPTDK